jgi:hypothetical protein
MEKRNASRILVGKPERKRPLGRQRRRWVVSIKIYLREDGMVWTGSIWFRKERPVEGSCGHDNEPSGYIKCWEVLE